MGNEVGEEGRFASARPVANRPSLDRGANSLEKVRVHFSGCGIRIEECFVRVQVPQTASFRVIS